MQLFRSYLCVFVIIQFHDCWITEYNLATHFTIGVCECGKDVCESYVDSAIESGSWYNADRGGPIRFGMSDVHIL